MSSKRPFCWTPPRGTTVVYCYGEVRHACAAADLHNCLHCPGEGPPAGLLQLWAPQGSGRARHMCWLSQGGIRHGSLLLDLETRPPSDLDYLRLDPDMPNPSAEPVLSMVSPAFCFVSSRAGSHTSMQ